MNLLSLGEDLDRPWVQKIVGEIDNSIVRVVRYYGGYPMHRHDGDQFVLVLDGEIDIEEEGKIIHLEKMDFHIIKKGRWHRPIANTNSLVMVIWKSGIKTELKEK